MATSNLPALRTSTAVAVPETTTQTTPTTHPDSGNYFLLAFIGAVLASSAAWSQMWAVAAGVGAGALALGVTGAAHLNTERRRR